MPPLLARKQANPIIVIVLSSHQMDRIAVPVDCSVVSARIWLQLQGVNGHPGRGWLKSLQATGRSH